MSKISNPSHVHELLDTMKNAFTSCSTGLFTISNDEKLSFEKALYAYLVAKPTKRLSSIFSLEKEILILFISFDDLQYRTINAAKKIITESQGRLEQTLFFVVHMDARGNTKLKNWGRESGISVIPIYFDNAEKFIDSNNLENLISHELYSNDPFDISGPVSDDTNFYGRRTESLELARKLQIGQIRSILGIRKIGKTSVINRVVHEINNNYDNLTIMIDCSRDDVWALDASGLMESIQLTLFDCIDNNRKYCTIQTDYRKSKSLTDSSSLISQHLKAVGKPVILLFDEIDYITPSSPTSKNWSVEFNIFWRNLRAIYQESNRSKINFSLLISGVTSKWFVVEAIEGVENAALSLIPEEYLSPLPRGASVAMIKKLGRVAGLIIPEKQADKISSFSADMPFWVRKACSFIHRNISVDVRPTEIDDEKLTILLDSFVQNEGAALSQVALRHLFRVYPELRDAFKNCYLDESQKLFSSHKNILHRYGLIKSSDLCQPSGEMIKEGYKLVLEETIDSTGSASDTSTVHLNEQKSPLSEWADEIAAISKRRNLLEKRLRNIVLNFIRMDSLINSQKKSAKERIVKIFEESIRIKYASFSAEEIIEKYCWLDLIKIIEKEWSVFEKLFGDKANFKQAASIVNDRPDAHAKDTDAADFALYRRAIKQLEEIIRKIE